MNILKILQKKRNERFSQDEEYRRMENEQWERFGNFPPVLPNFREAYDDIWKPEEKPLAEPVKPEFLNIEVEKTEELPPPKVAKFEVPERIGKDISEQFTRYKIRTDEVNERLVAITEPSSDYCEQYRKLRNHFLHTRQTKKLKTAVVASFGPAEGKSVTALNLAWLLAQVKDLRVLIIDADLRRSSLTDYLGIEADKGLSEVLTLDEKLADTIVHLEPSGLCLLPSGESREDVAELISSAKFRAILEEASAIFDVIIIDVPPLGLFSETSVLINQADGVILVARANKTATREVNELMHTLPTEKIICGILNEAQDMPKKKYYIYGN
ncbi:MAG TPA: CpsD/CapB family tyrosine-protein kinase [Pyrinomonadaceae bacterium]|nr:CpsD/CapB family tyrosine-protein kinase [Pyrinomonadaceae bacterium]